jgi:hypothetical protein
MSGTRFLVTTLLKGIALLGVVLALLMPPGAAAHDGYDHGPGDAAPVSDSLVAGHAAQATGSIAADSWSRSCPGGPGNTCCCGGFLACTGSGKTPVFTFGGWNTPVPALAGSESPWFVEVAPLSLLPPSLVLPRAPPLPA